MLLFASTGKYINNTQNDKSQSQIKAKLFNITVVLFVIYHLVSDESEISVPKKKKPVTCCSVLS